MMTILANGVEEFLEKGDKYFNDYDNVNAVINYEKAYEHDPDNYEVLLKLTRAYNDAGEEFKELRDRDEAEKYINKAIKISEEFYKKYPDSAAVYSYLALSYGNKAMFAGGNDKIKLAKKIEENASKSLRMDSNDYLPYVILGIYNRQIADLSWLERAFANTFFGDVPEGSFEESVEMLNKALKIKPNTIVATYQLAQTYSKMGEDKKAIELFNKVEELPVKNFRDKYAKIKSKRWLERLTSN